MWEYISNFKYFINKKLDRNNDNPSPSTPTTDVCKIDTVSMQTQLMNVQLRHQEKQIVKMETRLEKLKDDLLEVMGERDADQTLIQVQRRIYINEYYIICI